MKQKSFTSFKGSSLAFALLFPMDRIFEAYIATKMKKALPHLKVETQEQRYFLFDGDDNNKSSYRLRPDVVIRSTLESEQVVIVDTKWKLLKADGPSQADLYQMYAYFTRYGHHSESLAKVILLYPKSDDYKETTFKSLDFSNNRLELGAKIEVRYVDLFSQTLEKQIENLFVSK